MNTKGQSQSDNFRSLQILGELSKNDSVTQRDISNRLGMALGLVNSYLKNLVSKGFITVKSIPPKRYAYYLTPKGFAEKSRLTYHLLQDYNRIYHEARETLKGLFEEMKADGAKGVVFAGADEVAEIAYLTLQETGLALSGVIDDERAGKNFFGSEIKRMDAISGMEYDYVVVTSYVKRAQIHGQLLKNDIGSDSIKVIFPI